MDVVTQPYAGWSRGYGCRQTAVCRGMNPRFVHSPGHLPLVGSGSPAEAVPPGVRRHPQKTPNHRCHPIIVVGVESGQHLPMSLRCQCAAAGRPDLGLLDEDPRETISRLIAVEEDRLRWRQADLATARNALVRLHGLRRGRRPAIALITVEVALTLLRGLLDETEGPVRNVVMRKDVGSGTDEDWMSYNSKSFVGRRAATLFYDDSVLENPAVSAEIAEMVDEPANASASSPAS